ncbi:MAG TPA: hypothetical protein VF572_00805 [Candidatus Saccharimonadales bacterium]|jgi:hypothetical protein
MNKLTPNQHDQQGFIPLMLCVLGVIAFLIFLAYSRVAGGQ